MERKLQYELTKDVHSVRVMHGVFDMIREIVVRDYCLNLLERSSHDVLRKHVPGKSVCTIFLYKKQIKLINVIYDFTNGWMKNGYQFVGNCMESTKSNELLIQVSFHCL